MKLKKLQFVVEDGVGIITMNYMKNLNAIDDQMADELMYVVDTCENDPNVKVVVLKGMPKAFSAGGDIGYFYNLIQQGGEVNMDSLISKVGNVTDGLKRMSKLVISSVSGAAAGAGVSLAFSGDFVVCADNAKFIMAFVNLGLVPDTGGTYLFVKSLGIQKAMELCVTGRPMKAQEAKDAGMVYDVVPAEELDDTVMKLAKKFANGPLLSYKNIKKQIYHCNEGHAALINAQRLVDYIQKEGLSFNQALEVVRASSLYTVHTPVPAGHDYFDEGLFGRYMGEFPNKLGISWQEFIDMGRVNPGSNEKFCMSTFALNTCQEANGVSWLHGKVSQRMFAPIWKGYFPDELHVGYVTNGVHMPTWASTEWKEFFYKRFHKNFYADQSNQKYWEAIQTMPDEEIWNIRQTLKNKLIKYIKNEYKTTWLKNQGDPAKVVSILEKINPNALLIGFGRRFATYKRAHLLFTDLDRLAKIVNNEQFPIQFVFTGKAHPADGGGQGLIKHIIEISRRPEFQGKIIFLENYDMRLARHLIAGVDVWLNTPTRPLEASGTSGEKAEMNGVLNFSVLDGWWYEGYREGAGWALTDKRTYENQQYQDQLDAATIYQMLESEIIPTYYAKNSKGYSPEWIQYIKNSMSQIAYNYTMKRMLDDYIDRFYKKLATRSAVLVKDNYAKVKEIAAWKEEVAAHWDCFEVTSFTSDAEFAANGPVVGKESTFSLVIDRHELSGMLGAEAIITKEDPEKHQTVIIEKKEFELKKEEGTNMYFELKITPTEAGNHKLGFRIFPKNPNLPHRMDFAFVRWIQL